MLFCQHGIDIPLHYNSKETWSYVLLSLWPCVTRHTWAVSLAMIFLAVQLMTYCLSSSLHAVTVCALTSLFLLDTMKSKQNIHKYSLLLWYFHCVCSGHKGTVTGIIVDGITLARTLKWKLPSSGMLISMKIPEIFFLASLPCVQPAENKWHYRMQERIKMTYESSGHKHGSVL